MRSTINVKAIFFVLFALIGGFAFSQTLYWIGGSGNFNDPKNWSEKSGGPVANKIPDVQTAVVFDQMGTLKTEVYVNGSIHIQSIDIKTYQEISFLSKAPGAKIIVHRSFTNLLDNQSFQSNVDLVFRNSDLYYEGFISSGNNPLNCSVFLEKGNWQINKLKQNPLQTFKVSSSFARFFHASAYLGNLIVSNDAEVELKNSVLYSYNSIQMAPLAKFKSTQSYVNKKLSDSQTSSTLNFKVSAGSEQVNLLPCVPNPTVIKPSCDPGCDGTVIVTLPPANCFFPAASGNYNVLVNNNPTCTPISGLNNALVLLLTNLAILFSYTFIIIE
jgi:hypothetical protein